MTLKFRLAALNVPPGWMLSSPSRAALPTVSFRLLILGVQLGAVFAGAAIPLHVGPAELVSSEGSALAPSPVVRRTPLTPRRTTVMS